LEKESLQCYFIGANGFHGAVAMIKEEEEKIAKIKI
jgi:hypothetical protein